MFDLDVFLLTLLLNSRLLISAETVITCDGFVQHLSCDSGVIHVQSATCGRTSSQICSVGRPQSETANVQCSIDVPAVSKRCNGLRECELNTQGLAPQDPCYGTYKYYTTNYICIPAETSVTCHGGYSYLKCENGKIQINAANYGRTDKITCSEGRPSERLQNTNCYSPNALAPVSKSCNGLESCEVFATHTIFTDPCVGTYKYLAISYFCVQPAVRAKEKIDALLSPPMASSLIRVLTHSSICMSYTAAYLTAKCSFDAPFRKRIYRLHEAVSASLLHVSGAVLGGHFESGVRPRLLGHACHSTADPPGTGRRRQAGAAIGVAPHCLSAPHLVHQNKRGVEETAPSGLVVRPRG
uniref:L-rhamnose-binding lectin CSL2-like n=1 Tax=Sinocyclocheilus rhinocerous TaxID=307959 RepID=A0A673MN05_9TELE